MVSGESERAKPVTGCFAIRCQSTLSISHEHHMESNNPMGVPNSPPWFPKNHRFRGKKYSAMDDSNASRANSTCFTWYALAFPLCFWTLIRGSPRQGGFINSMTACTPARCPKETFAYFAKVCKFDIFRVSFHLQQDVMNFNHGRIVPILISLSGDKEKQRPHTTRHGFVGLAQLVKYVPQSLNHFFFPPLGL